MTDPKQVGGDHYESGAKTQWWQLTAELGIEFNEGCIVKYILRYRRKNGIEDLEKAVTYVDNLLRCKPNLYEDMNPSEAFLRSHKAGAVDTFLYGLNQVEDESHHVTETEKQAILAVIRGEYKTARGYLDTLKAFYQAKK